MIVSTSGRSALGGGSGTAGGTGAPDCAAAAAVTSANTDAVIRAEARKNREYMDVCAAIQAESRRISRAPPPLGRDRRDFRPGAAAMGFGDSFILKVKEVLPSAKGRRQFYGERHL